jgi:nucleoside-diphosphate-sugar epimerase
MASLLVIGGSGFFGKSILDAFQRNLLDSWGIDSLMIMARHPEELKKNNSQLIRSKVKLLKGDITSINELPFADYIIHAAASTDVRNYNLAPLKERSNIIRGTLNYCELAKKFNQKSKIVYISSGAVYGTQPYDLEKIPEDFDFLDVEQLPESKRDYAYAKRNSEKAINDLGNYGMDVSIARCFAFLGPWLPLDQHFAIGNFINDGLNCRPIKVNTNKKVYRSYMHADDLVDWLMTILVNSNSECPIFNVGSDEEISIHDLAFKISKIFNQEVLVCDPTQANSEERYIPSIHKARSTLNLYLKYDLDTSLKNTIRALNAKGKNLSLSKLQF